MSEEQGRLVFDPGVRGATDCVIEWRAYHGQQKLYAYWPRQRIGSYFRDWPHALASVLHPLNTHVRLKVRATKGFHDDDDTTR